MSKCWNEEKDTPDWPILLRDAVGHEVSNVAPVGAADRPARRDGTMQPPAALLPFFEMLATYDGPIPLSDLHAMVGSLTFTSDDLGDAIQIDTGGYVRTLVFERAHVEVLVMVCLPGQRSLVRLRPLRVARDFRGAIRRSGACPEIPAVGPRVGCN
jgi:hypothetical protein